MSDETYEVDLGNLEPNQFKDTTVDPRRVIAAVQPRSLEELSLDSLEPMMLKTNGLNTEKVMVWKLVHDSPLWDDLEGRFTDLRGTPIPTPSVEERKKLWIGIRGHRRCGVGLKFVENPDKYPATVCKNAAKLRAVEVSGISVERAEDLALDDEAKKSLTAWEAVVLVGVDLRRDKPYQQIAMEKTQLLYRSLLGADKGQAKYEVAMGIHDGAKRRTKILADLRNYLDSWVQTAHLLGDGSPNAPIWKQLELHFRWNKRNVPAEVEGKILMDCKLDNMRKRLRPLFNNANSNDWEPIEAIAVLDPEKGDKVPDDAPNVLIDKTKGKKVFYVKGGNLEIRKEIIALMREKAYDEKPDEGPKPPAKADQQKVAKQSRSDIGKAYANFFTGESSTVNGQTRQELDNWALDCQNREKKLAEIRDRLVPELQCIVDAMIAERNTDKLEEAMLVVNEMLKPSKK